MKTTDNFQEQLTSSLSKLILSASGWRGVFAASGDEEDAHPEILDTHAVFATLMARVYADFIKEKTGKSSPVVAVGMDARPTGPEIARYMIRELVDDGITVEYLAITAAPEIMAYSRQKDGFVYISASHNPIGHNGIKFGKNDGGVIPGSEANVLAANFRALASDAAVTDKVLACIQKYTEADNKAVYDAQPACKQAAVTAYEAFSRQVITDETDPASQTALFDTLKAAVAVNPLAVVCDFNGSARTLSIDNDFFKANGIGYYSINNKPGQIVHTIIPEPENLVHVAAEMERLQAAGHKEAALGYMPDCDGDRGNIVFWNERTGKAEVLKAQEVFALSVMAELAFLHYAGKTTANGYKLAVAVNDPTSMRIEEIARAFDAKVQRAEVGEANVVNCARELRDAGYTVRILGEGSNGGNITHPAAVRDPLNSLFALIKLLSIRDEISCSGDITRPGLFHLWCSLSGQEDKYSNSFTLADVMDTLPVYTTTGVSEPRALLHITKTDHAVLKANYQKVFEHAWLEKKAELLEKYGIRSYEVICNNGTKQKNNVTDYSVSGKGGLKILLKDTWSSPVAFIWMRGSGTEPVFRVMCDVKGNNPDMEHSLLDWHSAMIAEA
ncbi:MAG: phosphoglucomutase, partial [Treponemataceae bacterium]|nr:phosphoglucomutase [Treponemataceae bacterium]